MKLRMAKLSYTAKVVNKPKLEISAYKSITQIIQTYQKASYVSTLIKAKKSAVFAPLPTCIY